MGPPLLVATCLGSCLLGVVTLLAPRVQDRVGLDWFAWSGTCLRLPVSFITWVGRLRNHNRCMEPLALRQVGML